MSDGDYFGEDPAYKAHAASQPIAGGAMSTPCHDPYPFPFGERGEDHAHEWKPYLIVGAWEICTLCRGVRPSAALAARLGVPLSDGQPHHPEWHPSYREIL